MAGPTQFIQILNFLKHQNPHRDEKMSEIPPVSSIAHSASTVKAPGQLDKSTERLGLTPDSGLLTPDSSLREDLGAARHRDHEGAMGSLVLAVQEPGKAELVDRVFEHWKQIHDHPRASLDDKRRKVIAKALASYSEADLCQAISGYLNSPHHMGQNERDTRYDDIELLLRDAKHIDAGLKLYAHPPRTGMSEKTRRIVDQTADWVPPEMRGARAAS